MEKWRGLHERAAHYWDINKIVLALNGYTEAGTYCSNAKHYQAIHIIITIIISCFTSNWVVCNLKSACISASHSHPICYNSSNSSVFNKLKLILQTKLKLVIIFQLDLTRSSRDALVSRNLATMKTSHLKKIAINKWPWSMHTRGHHNFYF